MRARGYVAEARFGGLMFGFRVRVGATELLNSQQAAKRPTALPLRALRNAFGGRHSRRAHSESTSRQSLATDSR